MVTLTFVCCDRPLCVLILTDKEGQQSRKQLERHLNQAGASCEDLRVRVLPLRRRCLVPSGLAGGCARICIWSANGLFYILRILSPVLDTGSS